MDDGGWIVDRVVYTIHISYKVVRGIMESDSQLPMQYERKVVIIFIFRKILCI